PNRLPEQTKCPPASRPLLYNLAINLLALTFRYPRHRLCTPFLSTHVMEAPEPRFNHATSVIRQCAMCSPDTQEAKQELFRPLPATVPISCMLLTPLPPGRSPPIR
ncbi:unnamed protein product, partial [Ectocarpus sp. 12 AP-2014]